MGEHPSAKRIEQCAVAASAGDFPSFLASFSESCTWRVPGHSRVAGTLRGHEGIMAFFGLINENTQGTFGVVPEESLGSDGHVVIFLDVHGEIAGDPVEVRVAHFATVGVDGRFDRNWFLPSDVAAFDRLMGFDASG